MFCIVCNTAMTQDSVCDQCCSKSLADFLQTFESTYRKTVNAQSPIVRQDISALMWSQRTKYLIDHWPKIYYKCDSHYIDNLKDYILQQMHFLGWKHYTANTSFVTKSKWSTMTDFVWRIKSNSLHIKYNIIDTKVRKHIKRIWSFSVQDVWQKALNFMSEYLQIFCTDIQAIVYEYAPLCRCPCVFLKKTTSDIMSIQCGCDVVGCGDHLACTCCTKDQCVVPFCESKSQCAQCSKNCEVCAEEIIHQSCLNECDTCDSRMCIKCQSKCEYCDEITDCFHCTAINQCSMCKKNACEVDSKKCVCCDVKICVGCIKNHKIGCGCEDASIACGKCTTCTQCTECFNSVCAEHRRKCGMCSKRICTAKTPGSSNICGLTCNDCGYVSPVAGFCNICNEDGKAPHCSVECDSCGCDLCLGCRIFCKICFESLCDTCVHQCTPSQNNILNRKRKAVW